MAKEQPKKKTMLRKGNPPEPPTKGTKVKVEWDKPKNPPPSGKVSSEPNKLDILHEMRKQLEATENPTPKQLAELLALNTRLLVHLAELYQGAPKHRE